MGCCVSTHKNQTPPKHLAHPHNFPCVSKSPPRPEEEAVKEVLSETPKPNLKPNSRPDSPARELIQEKKLEEPTKPNLLLLTPKKPTPDPARYLDPCTTPEEMSEVSEMCSFSESISTNTLKEDDEYSNHHVSVTSGQRVFRSQGYNGNYHLHNQQHYTKNINTTNNNSNHERSPARRRPEPSPPRRRNPRQGGLGLRREMGRDNFNRRSQSPGVRDNVGRSPSARRNGPSPGRVRMVGGPEERKKMGVNEEEKRESEEWQGPKESLENPLVSLECFIFL